MRDIPSLRKEEDFKRIYRRRDSKSDELLIVLKDEGTGQIGIVCSKKAGNSIVRHRFCRLVREAYRKNRAQITEDKDIIVIAKKNIKGLGLSDIEKSFLSLLKRHSMIKKK